MTHGPFVNQIEDGLWQTGAKWLPDELPKVDIILHAYPLPESVAPVGHPPLGGTPTVHVPFGDHDHGPLDERVWDTLAALARVHAHRRVLTVCKEGKNRSGLMSALILRERGWSTGDAIALVKEKASSPGSVEALSNRAFLTKLREAP